MHCIDNFVTLYLWERVEIVNEFCEFTISGEGENEFIK